MATPGPANDKRAQARARHKLWIERRRNDRVVLPAVDLHQDEAVAWLKEQGMVISVDADASEIKSVFRRYWSLKFPRQ